MGEADDLQRKNLYLLLNPDGSLPLIIRRMQMWEDCYESNIAQPWSEVYWLFDQYKQTLAKAEHEKHHHGNK